jgi:hypothetical protein
MPTEQRHRTIEPARLLLVLKELADMVLMRSGMSPDWFRLYCRATLATRLSRKDDRFGGLLQHGHQVSGTQPRFFNTHRVCKRLFLLKE